MKKIIAWLLVVALTAAISIGATLAYLTDTDEDVNVMTLGKVKIDQLEYERVDVESKNDDATVQEFHDNKPLLPAVADKDFTYIPGDTYVDWEQIGKEEYTSPIWDPSKINNEQDKMVFIKNKGDYDAYVRSVFAFEAGKYATLAEFQQMVHLNLNETDYTWEWVQTPVAIPNEEGGTTNYFIATATYNKVLAPGALTEISLSQIALDKTATNADVEAFGDTYQILVKSQGIQADGFTDAPTALNEGFGEITTANIPFENDEATKGIDMITAVNTYNGKSITAKVQSIVFGKNADYPQIIAENEGVLVDIEQDVPVYAYYVVENGMYQIYLLADDTIYWPKDSTKMFNGMSNLVTMDTDNMSTARTTTFKGTFQGCNKLQELNVTNWDTSNVTDFIAAFNWCYELDLIGYENWNTSKVTNMAMLFQSNRAATELDLSKWDMSNVTTTASMFQDCQNLTTVNATGWDLSNDTNFNQMFLECYKLTEVKGISEWDTSKVTNFAMVFYRCRALEYVDVTKWDVGNGEVFNSMFATTDKLVLNKTDLKNWDMRNAVRINHMFYGALSIQELDLGGWNMPKLITTTHMFADCTSLKSVSFDDWNTPSLISLDCMFNDCDDLTYLDMSDIDTTNVTEFSQMFERCTRLQKVDGMENWDTSKSGTFVEMFLDCHSLEELNWSSFDTTAAYNNYYDTNNSYSKAFNPIFSGVNNLTKLIVSDKISYYGNGTVPEADKLVFPNPKAKEGYTAMWRNVETGELFLGKDIPEKTAATYEAYYQYISKGATVNNALSYLNADPKGTNIAGNVTGITFGLRKDYEAITSQYTGVLVDAEQNGPAYAYYVESNGLYQIYLLADDTIYLPANSGKLFNGMRKLSTLKMDNLSTERVTSMRAMFQNCTSLTTLDATGWDTSNVTDLSGMFYNCTALTEVKGTENWDLSSCTSLFATFYTCKSLQTVNTTGWNTSKVTSLQNMFQDCKALTAVPGISGWDTGAVTVMNGMFYGCENLLALDLSNWNTGNVTNMQTVFYGCKNLQTLNVSGWDTGKATTIAGMFNHCEKVQTLDVSEWNVSNVTNFHMTFQQCWALKELDVSNWNTGKGTDMGWMFYGCRNLEVIDISKWNVSNVTVMSHMFADCNKVKELKVDNWNVSKLQSMDATFNDCDSLTTINVSKWNTGNVREFSQTFDGCDNLAQVIGLENWNTTNGKVFDEMFNACKSLKVLNLSSFDTGNVTPGFKNVNGDLCKGFSSTFAGMNSVEKIILGPNFRFAGNGQVTEQYQPKFPNPAPIDGQATKWYNAANDTYYTAAEIPEPNGETVTYVAAIPPVNP